MAKKFAFNLLKKAVTNLANPRNVTGMKTVSAKEVFDLAKRDPGLIPGIVSNDHMYRAAFGLNNTRASSQYNLIRAIDTGYLVSPSSALTPRGRVPMIGNGYQTQGEGFGARVYITPEWTKPSVDNSIVTFRGDAYTADTKRFLSEGRLENQQYVPKAYRSFVSTSTDSPTGDGRNLSAAYHKILSKGDPQLTRDFARQLEDMLIPSFDVRYANGFNSWSRFYIGAPGAKVVNHQHNNVLHPEHDYEFLRTALNDVANGKPISMRLFNPGAGADGRAAVRDITLYPNDGLKSGRPASGVSSSLRDFWAKDGTGQYLDSGYIMPRVYTEDFRGRYTEEAFREMYENLKRDSFRQAVDSLNKHEIAMRNRTMLRGISADSYRGDKKAQAIMLDDLGGRPRDTVFVLDAEKGLPGSFYDWLGKHRYLENKVYGKMPISREAIGGVGIERDLELGTETAPVVEGVDKLRRSLDSKKIPWFEYGPGTGATEKDVQEVLAPTIHMAAKGGNTKGTRAASRGGDTKIPSAPAESSGGPRIVINPSTFRNEKDAMCVAWNEALRIVMEETGFEPVSEPTEEQRRFFADTDYADDELQLRRTILARICTFDTSVKDPTDEQVQEAVEFVRSVMEGGFPQNEWEQSCLKKLLDVLSSVPTAPNDGSPRTPVEPQQEAEPGATAAELGGQTQKEEERDLHAGKAVEPDPKYDVQGPAAGPQKDSEVPLNVEKQENRDLTAGEAIFAGPKNDAQGPAVRKEDGLW